jgi:diguanylate cyclase (GGDEF)-like protein
MNKNIWQGEPMTKPTTPIQPQAQLKNLRFFAVMDKFSLVQMAFFLFFCGVFVYLLVWKMAGFAGVGVIVWLLIFLRNLKQHSRSLFMTGVITSSLYAAFASLQLGWNSGFFLWTLSLLPPVFINMHLKKLPAALTGLLIGGGTIALFLLRNLAVGTVVLENKTLEWIYFSNLVLGVVALCMTGYAFEKRASEIESTLMNANKRLTSLAATDPVTNLTNRRTMLDRIDQEKIRLEQTGEVFTLIMIDIDNFKDINDEYGHDAGDFVLINLATIINFIVRRQDQVARWGGDEFLVFLPETNLEGGRVVAEKIRSRILTSPFIYHEVDIPVTVTLGVSACDTNVGIGNCIRKADLALYTGKQAGKNRVVIG